MLCILSRLLLYRQPTWKTIHASPSLSSRAAGKVDYVDIKNKLQHVYENISTIVNTGFLFVDSTEGFSAQGVQSIASILPSSAVVIGACCSAIASVDNMQQSVRNIVETDYLLTGETANFTFSVSNMPDTHRVGFHVPIECLEAYGEDEEDAHTRALSCVPTCQSEGGWKVIVLLVDARAATADLDTFIQALQRKHKISSIVGGIMGGTKTPLVLIQNSTAMLYKTGILGLAIGGATIFSSQVPHA